MKQYGLNIVWSRKQVITHANHYNLPTSHFIFLPYKATHSKFGVNYNINIGRYIFAGGNGKRDYQCLINAVRGTNIPLIISTTDSAVRKNLELLPNVIILGAPEPAFAQLQAAATIIVIPMIHSGLKGGGETNICNAMWHKKPVIAVDDMAAEDYIVEGETGYVVTTGNTDVLRERIIELWNDPIKCRQMGDKGRERAEKYFTQFLGLQRLLRLAMIYGEEVNKTKSNVN
jgi:glycosyltransferase involved in cell wall biosynthesis